MSVLSVLLNWVSSMTDPMKNFKSYATEMNSVHSDALQTFRRYVYTMDPNQALQQNTIISGDFADAIQQSVDDFSNTEIDISGFMSQYNRLLDLIEDLSRTAASIEGEVATTAAALEGESGIIEVTADVDIAAVAEGGANPIADIAGFILTLVTGAMIVEELKTLAENIYNDVQRLKIDIHNLELATYPPTAPEPKHVAIKPPDWQSKQLDQNQQIELAQLMNKYGYLAGGDAAKQKQLENSLESLLKMGLKQADIEKIMGNLTNANNGLTHDQILAFLNGIVTNNGDSPNTPKASDINSFFRLASRSNARYPLAQIVRQYDDIANIPGASRLLASLIESSVPKNKDPYRGYQFELAWVDAHREQIARVEDIIQAQQDGRPINRNVQAADVVFRSSSFTKGAVVDTKSYTWIDHANGNAIMPQWQIDRTVAKLIKQINRDKANYPGYPLVFVFDSDPQRGTPPQSVIDALTTEGATVMTSPPDKVVGVAQKPQPPDDSFRNGTPTVPGLPPGSGTPLPLPPNNEPLPRLPPGD